MRILFLINLQKTAIKLGSTVGWALPTSLNSVPFNLSYTPHPQPLSHSGERGVKEAAVKMT